MHRRCQRCLDIGSVSGYIYIHLSKYSTTEGSVCVSSKRTFAHICPFSCILYRNKNTKWVIFQGSLGIVRVQVFCSPQKKTVWLGATWQLAPVCPCDVFSKRSRLGPFDHVDLIDGAVSLASRLDERYAALISSTAAAWLKVFNGSPKNPASVCGGFKSVAAVLAALNKATDLKQKKKKENRPRHKLKVRNMWGQSH